MVAILPLPTFLLFISADKQQNNTQSNQQSTADKSHKQPNLVIGRLLRPVIGRQILQSPSTKVDFNLSRAGTWHVFKSRKRLSTGRQPINEGRAASFWRKKQKKETSNLLRKRLNVHQKR
jgi:hypothetical protein